MSLREGRVHNILPDMNSGHLQHLTFSVSGERSLETALGRIVRGLAAEEEVALARIWLLEPGDIYASCPKRDKCEDRTECLHLAAGDESGSRWTSTDGQYRCFPLGSRKVGQIGATGQPVHRTDVDTSPGRLRDSETPKNGNRQRLKDFLAGA